MNKEKARIAIDQMIAALNDLKEALEEEPIIKEEPVNEPETETEVIVNDTVKEPVNISLELPKNTSAVKEPEQPEMILPEAAEKPAAEEVVLETKEPIHEESSISLFLPGEEAPAPKPAEEPAPAPRDISMITCPKCHSLVPDNSNFCDICGTPLHQKQPQKKVCPACGKTAEAGDKFCMHCGRKLI